jgi:hypothetical protein
MSKLDYKFIPRRPQPTVASNFAGRAEYGQPLPKDPAALIELIYQTRDAWLAKIAVDATT